MNNKWLRWIFFAGLLGAIALTVLFRDQLDAAALEQWVAQAGAAGPLLYMLIYALGTVLFFPGSVMTLAGGALFGPYWGTFYNLTAATLGAGGAFLIARYLASDWVSAKADNGADNGADGDAKAVQTGRLQRIKQGVDKEGWRFVAFTRLVPLFPFNLLNYALGLTRIRFTHYLLASYICMLPGTFAYTYLGYAGREAVGGGDGLIQKGLLALALLAVVAFLPRIVGYFRSEAGGTNQTRDDG